MADVIANPAVKFSGLTAPLAGAVADAKRHVAGLDATVDRMEKRRAASHKSRAAALGEGIATGVAAGATFGLSQLGVSGAEGVKSLGLSAVQSAADFEVLKLSLDTILGSADKADKLLTQVQAFAAESPLSFAGAAGQTKQLLAVGVAAGQVVPTLRALTDVSAGLADGDGVEAKLKFVAKAFGDVVSSGRMTGQELRQFTEAGVPIFDALAEAIGKPREAIKHLAEEGEIGPAEVTDALIAMTTGAGKFAGMSEKYARTTAGAFDRLGDAWQTLKREVGGAIIEGLDLKGGARDLEAFAGRVRGSVGDIKPFVRLVGEGARAALNLANEAGKSGLVLAETFGASLVDRMPGLKDMPSLIKGVLKDAQDFKIDPVKVFDIGTAVFDVLLTQFDIVRGLVKGAGLDFEANLVTPLKEAAASLKIVADQILHVIGEVNKLKGVGKALNPATLVERMVARPGKGADLKRTWDDVLADRNAADVRGGHADMKGPRFREAFADKYADDYTLRLQANVGDKDTVKPTQVGTQDLWVQAEKLLGAADGVADKGVAAGLRDRAVLLRQTAQDRADGKAPAPGDATKPPTYRDAVAGELDKLKRRLAAGRDAEQAAAGKAAADRAKEFAAVGVALGGGSAGLAGALGGLAPAAEKAAAETRRLRDLAGIGVGLTGGLSGVSGALAGVGATAATGALALDKLNHIVGQIPPKVVALAESLNKEFKATADPVKALREAVANITTAADKKLITKDVAALGIQKAFLDAVKHDDAAPKLAAGAEYGSQEAARLVTQAAVNGPQSAEDLLRQLVAYTAQLLTSAQQFAPTVVGALAKNPPPTPVKLPEK